MNTVPASEVKRRGVAALEESLKKGPVHIIKNNRPRYVVLTEEEYQALTASKQQPPAKTLLEIMLDKPSSGARTRKEIDAWLKAERDSWDRT